MSSIAITIPDYSRPVRQGTAIQAWIAEYRCAMTAASRAGRRSDVLKQAERLKDLYR